MTTITADLPMSDDLPMPPLLERESTGVCSSRVCSTCPSVITGVDDWKLQCEICFVDPLTKRDCRVCHLPRIPLTEPEWKQVCGMCFKDSQKRACISCKEESIPVYEPAWRTLCKTCFSDTSKFRVCVVCKEPSIKPGMAKFLNKCTKCWLEEKQKKFIICPGCGRLDCRRGDRECRKCMISKGLVKRKQNPSI